MSFEIAGFCDITHFFLRRHDGFGGFYRCCYCFCLCCVQYYLLYRLRKYFSSYFQRQYTQMYGIIISYFHCKYAIKCQIIFFSRFSLPFMLVQAFLSIGNACLSWQNARNNTVTRDRNGNNNNNITIKIWLTIFHWGHHSMTLYLHHRNSQSDDILTIRKWIGKNFIGCVYRFLWSRSFGNVESENHELNEIKGMDSR